MFLNPSVLAQPAILPRPYRDGIAYLAYQAGGARSYLAGIAYTGSRWWFWPVSLAIKVPAAVLVLLIARTPAWSGHRGASPGRAARGPYWGGRAAGGQRRRHRAFDPSSAAWTAPPLRPGYAVATDSNLDWGQGLYALRSWSHGRTRG